MQYSQDDYVSVVYNDQRALKTDYPKKLINYLCNRFHLDKNSKLLELGSGRCDFLNEFSNSGFYCEGLDREETSVKNEFGLKVKICDLEKERYPYDDNSFDIIYHKSVIEHLYDPTNFMKESYRILKPNGKHIILTPDWHTQWKSFYEDFTHCRPYNLMALSDLLKIYNYKNIEVENFFQLPIVWKYQKLKVISRLLQIFTNIYGARWLTEKTGIKFFRWSVDTMVLGYGEK